MFRIKASERGTRFGENYTREYIQNYTQPIHLYLVAQFYHYIWEELTWRLWRKLEKFQAKDISMLNPNKPLPFTARQDLRCHYLAERKRINTEIIYLEMDGNSATPPGAER